MCKTGSKKYKHTLLLTNVCKMSWALIYKYTWNAETVCVISENQWYQLFHNRHKVATMFYYLNFCAPHKVTGTRAHLSLASTQNIRLYLCLYENIQKCHAMFRLITCIFHFPCLGFYKHNKHNKKRFSQIVAAFPKRRAYIQICNWILYI